MLENIRGLPNNNNKEAVIQTCSAKKAPLKIPQNPQKENRDTDFLLRTSQNPEEHPLHRTPLVVASK